MVAIGLSPFLLGVCFHLLVQPVVQLLDLAVSNELIKLTARKQALNNCHQLNN